MRGRLWASELDRKGAVKDIPQGISPVLSLHHLMRYTRLAVEVPFDR